ncbi:hypothetical protein [Aneurinibacillus tyrosinisolvens]|uniref:hypothetical protein n=1 Tax=Aneurinibacillus tyrosinisolvens TaxID=1443435 RepID=UPI00191BF479|nr:hypothetical protein [Aneurinibacillus tyrosinisolvens]
MERLDIVIGRKTNVPFSKGCYYDGGQWNLYDVDERQNFVVTQRGSEEEIFRWLYMITLGLAKARK